MLILLPLYFWLYCKSTANSTTIIFNCSTIFNYYHIQLLLHIILRISFHCTFNSCSTAVQSSDKFTYLLGLAKLCLPCDWQSSIASSSLPLYMKTSLLLQWIRISEALLNRGHARGSKITLTLWIETLWLIIPTCPFSHLFFYFYTAHFVDSSGLCPVPLSNIHVVITVSMF